MIQSEIKETKKRRRRKNRTEVLLSKPRAESPAIRGVIAEYTDRTVEELGGLDRLTAGEKALLLAQKVALLIILCVEEELVESGSLTAGDGKPSPLLKILESYLTVFRQGQVALGLGLRSRIPREDGLTMAKIMQEYESRQRPLLVPEKPSKKAGSKDKTG